MSNQSEAELQSTLGRIEYCKVAIKQEDAEYWERKEFMELLDEEFQIHGKMRLDLRKLTRRARRNQKHTPA